MNLDDPQDWKRALAKTIDLALEDPPSKNRTGAEILETIGVTHYRKGHPRIVRMVWGFTRQVTEKLKEEHE